ncbi:unnamed protein product, partial [marine sediment metagenome]
VADNNVPVRAMNFYSVIAVALTVVSHHCVVATQGYFDSVYLGYGER